MRHGRFFQSELRCWWAERIREPPDTPPRNHLETLAQGRPTEGGQPVMHSLSRISVASSAARNRFATSAHVASAANSRATSEVLLSLTASGTIALQINQTTSLHHSKSAARSRFSARSGRPSTTSRRAGNRPQRFLMSIRWWAESRPQSFVIPSQASPTRRVGAPSANPRAPGPTEGFAM
jgi:hypothetical protein